MHLILEPDVDFLTGLLSKGVLKHEQLQKIFHKETAYEKNDQLLNYLLDDSFTGDYGVVMAVLRDSRQEHVANYISSCGSRYFLTVGISVF